MAIIVPVLAKVEWAPQIDDSSIPSYQHEALQHIVQLLGLLARLDRDFRTAVALFNASHDENSDMARAVEAGTMSFGDLDLATDTLSGWQKMAARDGALSIYHFGQAGEAVRKSLPTCAALNAKVDHDALKVALADFRKAFNRYEAIRHVVGHVADWSATRALRRKHSHKGPWKGGSKTVQIDIQDAAAETQFLGNLYGNKFFVSRDGEVHSYEISWSTADTISQVKLAIYASVAPASIRKPTA